MNTMDLAALAFPNNRRAIPWLEQFSPESRPERISPLFLALLDRKCECNAPEKHKLRALHLATTYSMLISFDLSAMVELIGAETAYFVLKAVHEEWDTFSEGIE